MVRGMAIRQVTPPEAARELAATPHAVYLDVRTVEEFDAGHPAGARNVPVLVLDPATRRPRPNPEFLAVVQRHLPPATPLLVGCQSGMRPPHPRGPPPPPRPPRPPPPPPRVRARGAPPARP